MKALSCPQHFLRYSRAGNSEVDGQTRPEFNFVQDFMPILVICKYDDDPFQNKGAIMSTTFSPLDVYGKKF